MDIVELARDLGKKIQEDERFIAMRVASQQCDADEALQNMIGEFNLKRMAINNEAQKEDRSEDLLRQYNNELRTIYADRKVERYSDSRSLHEDASLLPPKRGGKR